MNFNNEFPGNASRSTDPGLIAFNLKNQLEELLSDIDQERKDHQPPLLPLLQNHWEIESPFFVNKQPLYGWSVSDRGPMWRRSMEAFRQLDAAGKDACLKALYDLWNVSEDEARRMRVAAVEVLGSMGSLAPIEPLILALADPFWDVRAAAAQALGNLGENTPVSFLTILLEWEKDESVRETIIRALGRQGRCMPVRTLIGILRHDTNWMSRQAAAWALGELRANAPHKWLRYALKYDEDECVRIAAAKSLGQTGRQQEKKGLYEALLDPEEEVREAARGAIEQLDNLTFSCRSNGEKAAFHLLDALTESPPNASSEKEEINSSPFERDTDPGHCETLEEEREDLLLWEGEEFCASSKVVPKEEESWRGHVIGLLTNFLQEKPGDLCQPHLVSTVKGPILLFTCFYQHSRALQEVILPSIRSTMTVPSIDAALQDHDDTVGHVVKQVFETVKERTWIDWVLVSLELSHQSSYVKGERAPLRVMVSAMSSQERWNDESFVLNQLVSTWITTVKEPTVCQRPHDLTQLHLWYQRAPDYFVEEEK